MSERYSAGLAAQLVHAPSPPSCKLGGQACTVCALPEFLATFDLVLLYWCRQANAALQVWQPAVVYKTHQRVVDQTPVDVRSCLLSLCDIAWRPCANTVQALATSFTPLTRSAALPALTPESPNAIPNPYQSEWRLRNLREALRDNRVFLEGKARSLRRTGERLSAELAQLRAHGARYGSAVQATLARFSAHPYLSYRSVE